MRTRVVHGGLFPGTTWESTFPKSYWRGSINSDEGEYYGLKAQECYVNERTYCNDHLEIYQEEPFDINIVD